MGGPNGTREPNQEELGAILLIPSQYWEEERGDLSQWLPDGFESEELQYDMSDIVVFAKVNFTPDVWFYVTRGPLVGKVFRWLHDDASDLNTPWADDLTSWADRIWREVPTLFGGIIRWDGSAAADKDCPANAQLYPLEFVSEQHS